MNIHMLAKDQLEEQGIRWIIESHLTGVKLSQTVSLEGLFQSVQKQRPDLVIFDMDRWGQESERFLELLQKYKIRWLGISSERIFQTAYRALRLRAEDVLFRPFSADELVKHIQQIRYQTRNELPSSYSQKVLKTDINAIDYPDLFLTDQQYDYPITMVAFLTPNSDMLHHVFEALQRSPFPDKYKLFALSDFILCVQEPEKMETLQEMYHSFLTRWKERMDEPLAIVINNIGSSTDSLKQKYQQIQQLAKRIFFEGYDIILAGKDQMLSREMDPFLTPLEQRQWIEMLEKQNIQAIREWVEHEFLTYEQPYPDPEMVRIRLTSVLAQIRRHMKSYNLQSEPLEARYHEVFQQIIHKPVIYQIVQELLAFTVRLLDQVKAQQLQEGPRSLVEKAREFIESNYWDAGWNLAACADALRINKSTLSRRFAAESGISFRDLLHQVRIREAKRLLHETDLSLEEVAKLTGYAHQTYFNAKFKQLEGCTPSAYRSGYSH
ncbi:helix-turn-helix domain-containing protein [Bacillus sp. DTU_2020_1000418_1_SI_GHA_SEK_038]|uniref:response regulator transcription factor n=1 Tax=Bacillus sp. DTU_2020_1000418_1_SI_GHA_SEK_038 TaxID=3077585 RepID=UPI0028EAC289|nr:helix-turn-helix domain-containing protein [Bacillus sp. DTU_2020_1000418_1_SI_GHA_SEK_038]WNS75880.1 helix-turn-helix domain-containing protein [Bacillus sp. DTU_2020_1000418_1_SI_GHA_SEK_038]